MTKYILVLPSGTEISAGAQGNALMSVQIAGAVNGDEDLTPGAAITSCLELVIWTENDNALIHPGDELGIFSIDTDGTRHSKGVYIAEKPTRKTAYTYAVTAYDNVSKLDKNLSSWLSAIKNSFPMSQAALLHEVATQCGVEVDGITELPFAGFMVSAFYADNISGRQIFSWIAAANGRYVTATPSGAIAFAWYGSENDTTSISKLEYYQGGLTYDDFECPPIDGVQIRQSDNDTGVVYPSNSEQNNLLIIQGNLVLANAETNILLQIAQTIYEQMHGITTYRPGSLVMPEQAGITLGGRITVVNSDGVPISMYVMRRTVSKGKMTLESFGTSGRDSTSSVNNMSYREFAGKMFEMSASIDGLKTKAADAEGKYSELSQTVEGISATVSGLNGEMTEVEQTVQGLSTRITSTDGKVLEITQTIDGLTVKDEQGQTLIAGGMIQTDDLYLARLFSRDGVNSYVEMLDNGLNFVLGLQNTIGIGYYSAERAQPYIIFGAGTTPQTDGAGMVKKYANGIWIGDSADREESAIVSGTGILIDTEAKKIYKYNNGIGVELVDTSTVVAVFG